MSYRYYENYNRFLPLVPPCSKGVSTRPVYIQENFGGFSLQSAVRYTGGNPCYGREETGVCAEMEGVG